MDNNCLINIAAEYDSNNEEMRLYVQGELVASNQIDFDIIDVGNDGYIGSNLDGDINYQFSGIIDNLIIWNNTLPDNFLNLNQIDIDQSEISYNFEKIYPQV